MKRSDLVFAAVKVPLDFSMLMAAGLAAYFLRIHSISQFRPVLFEIPLDRFLAIDIACALFFIVIFALSGLYSIGSLRIRNEIQRIFTACSTGIMAVIVYIFFVQELFSSRFIVLAAWLLGFLFVVIGRSVLRLIQNALHARGVGCQQVVIIGTAPASLRFAEELGRRTMLGYVVRRVLPDFGSQSRMTCDDLLAQQGIDEIVVLDTKIAQEEFASLREYTIKNHIGLRYSAERIGGTRIEISMLIGEPLIEVKKTRLEGWGKIWKRIFDVAVSAILILLFSPLMLIVAVCIRIESRGSPLYFNERVGESGKRFPTLKFRTMLIEYCTGSRYDPAGTATKYELELAKTKSERQGPIFKILDDPRRTRLGRLLERFSIDELPQLFNVFAGHMSLVGPRPHMPIQVDEYESRHHQLLSIKPGITGMAQIEGRSDLDFEDEARLDLFYIENWSPKLDFVILAKTPWVVLSRTSRV